MFSRAFNTVFVSVSNLPAGLKAAKKNKTLGVSEP